VNEANRQRRCDERIHQRGRVKDAFELQDLVNEIAEEAGQENGWSPVQITNFAHYLANDACPGWGGLFDGSRISRYVADLGNKKSSDIPINAAKALGEFGPAAQKAVPALIKTLLHPDQFVRASAAAALGQIGPAAKDAVPALTQTLSTDDNNIVRSTVLEALEKIGVLTTELIVKKYIADLRLDYDTEVRARAAQALSKIGPEAKQAFPSLTAAMDDSNGEVRAKAAAALIEIDEPAAAEALKKGAAQREERAITDAIYKLQNSRTDHVRGKAAKFLGETGPAAKDAVPALIKALDDWGYYVRHDSESMLDSIHVRDLAAQAIAQIGESAIPSLIETLTVYGNSESLRANAAQLLGRIGPPAKEAVPALIKALSSENSGIQASASAALGEIGPAAKEAVPALIKALSSENIRVRASASAALGQIGPAAKDAVPALTQTLSTDDQNNLRSSALEALEKIGVPTTELIVKKYIADLLLEHDSKVRALAAQALGKIGPEAKQAFPSLTAALDDSNGKVRAKAAAALIEIDKPAAAEVLKKSAAEREERAIEDAIDKLQNSKNFRVRGKAAQFLGKTGRAAKDAVPALTQALRDKSQNVSCRAAEALAEIGPAAKEAVPALEKAAKHINPYISRSAAEALRKIEASQYRSDKHIIKNPKSTYI